MDLCEWGLDLNFFPLDLLVEPSLARLQRKLEGKETHQCGPCQSVSGQRAEQEVGLKGQPHCHSASHISHSVKNVWNELRLIVSGLNAVPSNHCFLSTCYVLNGD